MIERLSPKDRAAWLALRGRDVTASVVGALFGAHDFMTVYELWAVKTRRVERSSEETAAMQRGRLLEPVAVQLLREQRPEWKIEHNAAENVYFRDPDARLGATPDVIVDAPGRGRGVVQIKSVEASIYRRKWLVDGNPEPPLWIALQAAVEAYLTGAQWAAVAPLIIGHGLEMPLIEIALEDGLIDAIKGRVAEFWNVVESGLDPPPDFARDGGTIEAMHETGSSRVEVDLSTSNRIRELIDTREAARLAAKDAKAKVAEIDAEVKWMMGEAEIAHIGQGQRITWKQQKRAGFYVAPKSFRVLHYPATEKEGHP